MLLINDTNTLVQFKYFLKSHGTREKFGIKKSGLIQLISSVVNNNLVNYSPTELIIE